MARLPVISKVSLLYWQIGIYSGSETIANTQEGVYCITIETQKGDEAFHTLLWNGFKRSLNLFVPDPFSLEIHVAAPHHALSLAP